MRMNKVSPDSQTYTALIGMCARAAVEEASFNAAAGTESNTMVQKAWELLGKREDCLKSLRSFNYAENTS